MANRQHIIEVGVCIDEDTIVNTMVDSLSKKLSDEVEKGVKKTLFDDGSYWHDGISARAREVLYLWMDDNKEELLDRTSKILADKLSRTKAAKELIAKIEV